MKEIKEYLNKCRDISCARIGRLITIKSKVFPTWSRDSTLSKSQQVILLVSQFSHSVMSNSLQHHGLQQARLPCPSPTPRAPTQTQVHRISDPIQPSHPLVIPLSSHLQSFPASRSFPMSQFLSSGGQRKYWSFSFSISPSNEYSVLISFRMDWFDLLAV